jgi:arylsulfatase
MFKTKGYATCHVGKWHLGDAKPFLPTKRGFDEYFGLPYSNDMRNNPNGQGKQAFPPLPLYDGEKVIETDPDQRFLTHRYTERSVDFIKRNKEKPFFLYHANSMPHIPLHVHPDFEGKSEHGLYGDVIQELDWGVGEIMKTLKECGIDDNTLVIFSSDNGPWLIMGENGGHAQPLRDGKGSKYEGGHRVTCAMRWPKEMKAGSVGSDLLGSIDLFPTFAAWIGAKTPQDRVIDGIDCGDYILGKADKSPREYFYYNDRVICDKVWKYFDAGEYAEYQEDTGKNKMIKYDNYRLYNIKTDISESKDVAAENPEVVKRLKTTLDGMAEEIKKNSRPLGLAKDLK